MTPRFGILTFPSDRFEEIAREWRAAEDLGFTHGWIADSLVGLRGLQDYEAWTVLAALARETSRLRIGTLISVIPFRHPTLLAAEAITLDHLSDGRFELGIGAGERGADDAALGLDAWPAGERIDRLEEQLVMLDRLLRGERLDHAGRFYRAVGAQLTTPVQRPRPPIVVAAQGARGLRLVARIADGWNSLGGQPPRPADPIPLAAAVERTREQVGSLERSCAEFGRDPKSIRRSVLGFRTAVDPLSSIDRFDDFVGRYTEAGIEEFVFYWPPISNLQRKERVLASQRTTLERIAADRFSRR